MKVAQRYVSLLLLTLMLVAACAKKDEAKKNKPKMVPVTEAVAVQKDVPVLLTSIGNAEPFSTVSVRARVGGQLQRIHFREGQDVNKGDILFTVDPRPSEAALRQAEAALARDTAQMENTKKDAARYEELVRNGYVAQSQYEQLRANADALQAVVAGDRAAVDNARLQLSYCSIHAPIAGRTGSLLVNQGNLVKADDEKALVVINQIQPIYVGFSVPEQQLPEIKRQMAEGPVRVSASTGQAEGNAAEGTLTFIDNTVDRATGTIRLKATFENKDRRLWPGQFVNITLRLATERGATVVPTQAIMTGQKGQQVFVITPDSTVEMRPVTVTRAINGETAVKGVSPGERVVTDGQLQLVPKAKVAVKGKAAR
ncbi:MAG: efflux RND transporter periplasmic adaptor subunit [Thermodesulfovibrionales bacterium]|jgi:multidrug efflux system membrane fusion protein